VGKHTNTASSRCKLVRQCLLLLHGMTLHAFTAEATAQVLMATRYDLQQLECCCDPDLCYCIPFAPMKGEHLPQTP
jgi:hypothetical protein